MFATLMDREHNDGNIKSGGAEKGHSTEFFTEDVSFSGCYLGRDRTCPVRASDELCEA